MMPNKEAILFHDLIGNYEHYRHVGEHETAKAILGVLVGRIEDHIANYTYPEPAPEKPVLKEVYTSSAEIEQKYNVQPAQPITVEEAQPDAIDYPEEEVEVKKDNTELTFFNKQKKTKPRW